MKYRVTIFNRWDGCPVSDIAEDMPPVTIDALTISAARAAAASLGFTPTMDAADDADDITGADVGILPTWPGAESAWIWFYSI